MHVIKILGSGCRTCVRTTQLFEQLVAETGAPARVEKVEDLQQIMSYGIMATPGIVIDEKVVHIGMPKRSQALAWLAALEPHTAGDGQANQGAPGTTPSPPQPPAPKRKSLLGRILKR